MTPEQKQRIEQIERRRARVENGNLDYATTDTGTRCVGYLYEKETGEKVAQMESLYDVMRGELFANAASDIDFLLSLVKSEEAVSVHAAAEAATRRLCKAQEVITGLLDLRIPEQREGFQIWLEDAMTGVATSMRSACLGAVKLLWSTNKSNDYNGAINDAVAALLALARRR